MASRQDFPTETVAKRVRALRDRRGLTAEQLADRMREVGVPFDKTVIANLETGRRRFVTVQELLALACVLNVSPLHLMVPPLPSSRWGVAPGERVEPNDGAAYQVTPEREAPMYRVRQFIRGHVPLPGMDERQFYAEVPPHEWSPLVEELANKGLLGGDDGDR